MKGKRVWKMLILCCFLLGFLQPTAAADAGGMEEPAFDGYLFRLKEEYLPVQLYSLPEGIDLASPEIGLYRADSLEEIQNFAAAEALAYVEPNYYVTLFEAPDDPRYGEQWSLEMIGAENAWGWNLDGTGVRIGLIDSGLNVAHEDLTGAKILPGYNFLPSVEDTGDTSDDVGHGTFVAGVIAAQKDNGLGIVGLADGAELVPLKCFSSKNGTIDSVVTAILKGVDEYGCDILNMSFGVAQESDALQEAINYAAGKGVILVAAVGNAGDGTVYYPAAYDSVIGVGAVDSGKAVAWFSQRNSSVHIMAPGQSILGLAAGDSYRSDSGTSYSCPLVTAAAALLKQAKPELTGEEFAALLAASAEDLGEEGYDETYGYGLMHIPDLVEMLARQEELQITQQDGNLVLQGGVADLNPTVHIFAALYGENERLLSCMELRNERILNTTIALPKGAASGKLFFLEDGTLCPVRAAETWTAAETGQ